MEKKSRILIVGATGNLGFELAKASLQASHPTFALLRDSAFSDRLKSRNLQTLSDQGASLLKVPPSPLLLYLSIYIFVYIDGYTMYVSDFSVKGLDFFNFRAR